MNFWPFFFRSTVFWLPIVSALYLLISENIPETHNGYCNNDNFNIRSTYHVEFTKELSSAEYGPVNGYKTLNCCAKNYKSLEWFKDGKPYPWTDSVSTFKINPDSNNQSIYAEYLKKNDQGKYTCVLVDFTSTTSHSFHLSVTGDGGYLKGPPLWTYKMPSISSPSGQSVRLYCEAFVGKAYPDSSNTITWRKKGDPQAIQTNGNYKIEKVVRESDLVLGAFLYIRRMVDVDYGQYECIVKNTAKQTAVHSLIIFKSVGHEQTVPYKLQDRINTSLSTTLFFIWVNCILFLCMYFLMWFESVAIHLQNIKLEFIKRTNILMGRKRTLSMMIFHSKVNRAEAIYMKEKMTQRNDYNFHVNVVDLNLDVVKNDHFLWAKDHDFAMYIMAWNDTESKESYHSTLRCYENYGKCKVVACEMPNTPTLWVEKLIANLYGYMAKDETFSEQNN